MESRVGGNKRDIIGTSMHEFHITKKGGRTIQVGSHPFDFISKEMYIISSSRKISYELQEILGSIYN